MDDLDTNLAGTWRVRKDDAVALRGRTALPLPRAR
jgi:hypothetical protein